MTSLKTPIGLQPVANGFLAVEQGRYRVRRVSIPDVASADSGTIVTVAGNGNPGNGQALLDGAATAVSLNLPCCVSTTAGGDTLVADTLGGMVWRVAGTRIRTVAGSGAPSSCPPTAPSAIAAQSAALCFVVGVGASPGQERFLIAEDGLPDQGRSGGARVYEVDAAGVIRVVAGGGCPNPSPAAGPLGICLANPRGPLYSGNAGAPTEFLVADRGRNVVWRIASTNPATATATAIAGTGQATAADMSNLGDDGPAGQATFSAPSDLALTPGGQLLVADRNNCRVRRIAALAASGTIETIAGTSCAPDAAAGDDGPAALAGLAYPQGVAFSPQGILVSESLGGRVRLVQRTTIDSGPPTATTVARSTFAFESVLLGAQFRCAVDGETPPVPCSSPMTYAGLADGPHSFTVFDSTAPADPSPASWSWTIDTTPPLALELAGPAAGTTDAEPRAEFSWRPTSDATTGVDRYELLVDGAVFASVRPGECAPEACNAHPQAELGEGAHVWRVRAVDGVGLYRESEPRAITVGSDPVARLSAAPDPVLAGSPVGLDASASHDEGGPIVRYEWDLDGNGTFELDTGARPYVSREFPVAGVIRVSVRVTDVVGRSATATRPVRVSNPPGAPRLYGVSVNRGEEFTRTPGVKLDLVYPESTTGVVMSNDGGFMTAMALEPSSRIGWRLASTGSERLPKTVYVRFLSGPFVTETYSDDIVLDETRPTVTTATVRTATRRTVRLSARDNASGVAWMQIGVGRRNSKARFVRYKRTIMLARGTGAVWVRVRDNAGNTSPWRRADSERVRGLTGNPAGVR